MKHFLSSMIQYISPTNYSIGGELLRNIQCSNTHHYITFLGLKGSDVCPPGTVLHSLQGRCIRLKGRREALDAPMTHKTKRGEVTA